MYLLEEFGPLLTFESIHGRAKTLEDTENRIKGTLPSPDSDSNDKSYRVVYAVHRIREPAPAETSSTEFIGLVIIRSLDGSALALPEDLTLSAAAATTILSLEVAYMLLPRGWGKGYGTEAVGAMFEACRSARAFWAPWDKIYIRAIVNEENPQSVRVMEKTGMVNRGMYVWTGKPIWLAGQWTERSGLHIFGRHMDIV